MANIRDLRRSAMHPNVPDVDVIAKWQGNGNIPHPFGQWESKCRVTIFQNQKHRRGLGKEEKCPTIVVCSDLGQDSGTWITNCAENVATRIKKHWELEEPIMWIEHYPGGDVEFSQCVFDWNGEKYIRPHWTYLQKGQVFALLDCSHTTFAENVDELEAVQI